MEDIKVTSAIDFKTYLIISLRASFNRSLVILTLIAFAFLQYSTFLDSAFTWKDEFFLISIYGGIFGIVLPLTIYFKCKHNMKTVPYLSETLLYIINDEKIEVKGDSISNSTNWQYVTKLIEREKYFLLRRAARNFNYLPKQGFQSKEDMLRLKAIAKEKGIKFSYK
jgi:hypothetical protein